MNKMTLQLLEVGSCTQLEKLSIHSGKLRKIKFPAMVGLIYHPTKGYILFDTGYSKLFTEKTKSLSSTIYKMMTPVFLPNEENLWVQLKNKGIDKEDITHCIISHFHADHIAGLRELDKNTELIAYEPAYNHIKHLKGIKALKEAYIPELMPHDIEDKLTFLSNSIKLPKELTPFKEGYDIFGDDTLYAIVLDGHAQEQIGLYIKPLNIFLCADAAWSLEAIEHYRPPLKVAKMIKSDYHNYLDNLLRLHKLYQHNNEIRIIPSHCNKTIQSLKGRVISE